MDAERVYVPLRSKTLAALDRQTGRTVWTASVDTVLPPLAGNGEVYVAAVDGLEAIDASTGVRRWRTALERAPAAAMTSTNGWLFAVIDGGEALGVRIQDGAVIWRRPLGAMTPYAPVTDGRRLFVSLADGRMVALAVESGMPLWDRHLPGALSAPALANDRVFVGSDTNDFVALSPDSGDLEWRWRVGGDVVGADADDDRVFFASLDNLIRCVNRGNGNQRWRKEISTRPALPPQVAGDVVLITGVAPVITSYDSATGAVVGSYTAPAELLGPPLIDPVLKPFRVAMVVVTRDGRASGVYPTAMLFKEPTLGPLSQLPGERLNREPAP